ncbi:hypothetical protein COY62_01010 [bacterium (Candidatus Howlettbacteria) CG_4_10_14_0_8_um_filter_40_9]|nr:MAG: hypothetical protein COY62_01010 [bacterium (Candidatus Howlettbacteria) CG_4_10_14_0_8_um_filter_40_9]
MGKGVKIFLEPGTRIPRWISSQDLNVTTGSEQYKASSRKCRVLEIRGGEASFFSGGSVVVKMPWSDVFHGAFNEMRVFEIRNLEGNGLIQRNWHLCKECGRINGTMIRSVPSKAYPIYRDSTFGCSEGHQWELEGI